MRGLTWFVVPLGAAGALAAYWFFANPAVENERAAGVSVADALGNGDTTGFARAYAPRPFVFPQDHGPHPEYKHEWWYFTGNLESQEGRRFGFQLTIFRIALTPKAPKRASDWGTNQVYMAHFALSDMQAQQFHYFERFSRGAAGLAGASSTPFRIWVGDWFVEKTNGVGLALRLYAKERDVAVDLRLQSKKPIVPQGENGLSRKSAAAGNASYYYSASRLSTQGVISINGQRINARGLSWLDREWSTSALEEGQVGWDWFALQLSDGRDIMFYRLRRQDGSADPFSSGSLIDVDGSKQTLSLRELEVKVSDYWQSPQTLARYPSGWHLRIPQQQLDIDVTPLFVNQELNLSVRYWEGAVKVMGTSAGVPIKGLGYVELTGYGSSNAD
ncbi:MAG: lipocalin-like domain-containing protein [Acidiferrobacterales bacterium]